MPHQTLTTRLSAIARETLERSRKRRAAIVKGATNSQRIRLQVESLESRQLLAFMPWSDAHDDRTVGSKFHLDRPHQAETGTFSGPAGKGASLDRDGDLRSASARSSNAQTLRPVASEESTRLQAVRCQLIVICETTVQFNEKASNGPSGPSGAKVTTSYRVIPVIEMVPLRSSLNDQNAYSQTNDTIANAGSGISSTRSNSNQSRPPARELPSADQPIRLSIPVSTIKQQLETLAVTNVTRTPTSVVFTLTAPKESAIPSAPTNLSHSTQVNPSSATPSLMPANPGIVDSLVGLQSGPTFSSQATPEAALSSSVKPAGRSDHGAITVPSPSHVSASARTIPRVTIGGATHARLSTSRDFQAALFGLALEHLQIGEERSNGATSIGDWQWGSLSNDTSGFSFLNGSSDMPRVQTRLLAEHPTKRLDSAEVKSDKDVDSADDEGLSTDERLERWFSLELWDFDAQDAAKPEQPLSDSEESDNALSVNDEGLSPSEANVTDNAWAQWSDADQYGGMIGMSDAPRASRPHRPDLQINAPSQLAHDQATTDRRFSFLELDSAIGNAQAFQVLQSTDADPPHTPTIPDEFSHSSESDDSESDELTQSPGPSTLETSALTLTLIGYAARPSRSNREQRDRRTAR